MENTQSPGSPGTNSPNPEPEILKPRTSDAAQTAAPPAETKTTNTGKKRRVYRPSHRATFISLGVVAAILVVNAAVIGFVLTHKSKGNNVANSQVVISPDVLDKLGVNSTTLGASGVQLIVGPDAQFKGKVTVAGATTISGTVNLNSQLTGTNASFTQLQGGNTSLSQLDVNGSLSATDVTLRGKLGVTGLSTLLGPVTISQLLTVNSNANISGNLAVGGSLSTNNFSAQSLTSTSTLTIGGHVITGGPTPNCSAGSALGSNGTASISGNDSAGTISIGVGAPNGGGGSIATVTFHTKYGGTPHVVITPIGMAGEFYLGSVTTTGFSVWESGPTIPPGGYSIDYIVEQ